MGGRALGGGVLLLALGGRFLCLRARLSRGVGGAVLCCLLDLGHRCILLALGLLGLIGCFLGSGVLHGLLLGSLDGSICAVIGILGGLDLGFLVGLLLRELGLLLRELLLSCDKIVHIVRRIAHDVVQVRELRDEVIERVGRKQQGQKGVLVLVDLVGRGDSVRGVCLELGELVFDLLDAGLVVVYLLLQAVQLLLGLVVLLAGRDSGILERFEVGVFSKCCHRHRTCHEGSRDGCYSGMAKESCRCSHLF